MHMDDYELLTSTRWDTKLLEFDWNEDSDGPSALFLLPYHFDRLIVAAGRHSWDKAKAALVAYPAFKSSCLRALESYNFDPSLSYRLRLTVSQHGKLKIGVAPSLPFSFDPMSPSLFNPNTKAEFSHFGNCLNLYLDTESTPSSLFTTTKTTRRIMYDQARQRARLPSPVTSNPPAPMTSDVILHDDGLITETSICNIAFYRGGKWVTPPATAGGLPGVTRRWLLEQGRIMEADEPLTTNSIKEGEWALVFNGVQGCLLGRVGYLVAAK